MKAKKKRRRRCRGRKGSGSDRREKTTDVVRQIKDLLKPSEDEVEKHNATRLPYRNWCPICVRAKGKDADHRRVVDGSNCLPEFSFDYAFPGIEFGYKLRCWWGGKGQRAWPWPRCCRQKIRPVGTPRIG